MDGVESTPVLTGEIKEPRGIWGYPFYPPPTPAVDAVAIVVHPAFLNLQAGRRDAVHAGAEGFRVAFSS
jgi:hypothetical protein